MSFHSSTRNENGGSGHTDLDTVVLHIELTLISIIQGVALTFLVEHSYEVLADVRFLFWPYVASGLLTVLIFWSRALVHTLTVIRWPLELTHNFMYIACSLLEAVAFTQLANPFRWYTFNALFSCMVLILFVVDLRMIRRCMKESGGPTSSRLYGMVQREQLLSIRFFMPATLLFNLFASVAVRFWPGPLVHQGGHALIGLLQMAGALVYLMYGVRFFSRVLPLIAGTRVEWCRRALSGA
jgi:hypothetical protein